MIKDKAQEKEKMVRWWSKWWKEKKWDYSGDLGWTKKDAKL